MCGIDSCCDIVCEFRLFIAGNTHICSCEKSERFGQKFICGTPMCDYMVGQFSEGNYEHTQYYVE